MTRRLLTTVALRCTEAVGIEDATRFETISRRVDDVDRRCDTTDTCLRLASVESPRSSVRLLHPHVASAPAALFVRSCFVVTASGRVAQAPTSEARLSDTNSGGFSCRRSEAHSSTCVAQRTSFTVEDRESRPPQSQLHVPVIYFNRCLLKPSIGG